MMEISGGKLILLLTSLNICLTPDQFVPVNNNDLSLMVWTHAQKLFKTSEALNIGLLMLVWLLLLLEKVAPSCSDKVPGQRHPHNVPGDVMDGRCGILLADFSWVECVLQIPGSAKKRSYKASFAKTLWEKIFGRRSLVEDHLLHLLC